jgi:hypothetical protein
MDITEEGNYLSKTGIFIVFTEKVKVKFALEQAMKAQRESRGISLFL